MNLNKIKFVFLSKNNFLFHNILIDNSIPLVNFLNNDHNL